MHLACCGECDCRAEIVQYLIDRGADVNAISTGQYNMLHYAVYSGNLGIVKLLLKYMSQHTIFAVDHVSVFCE